MLGTPSITSIAVSPIATTRGEANSERKTPPAMPIGPLMSTVSPLSWSEPTIAFKIPGSVSSGLLAKKDGTRYGAAFNTTKMMRAISGKIARKAAIPTRMRITQFTRCRVRSPEVGSVSSFAIEPVVMLMLALRSPRIDGRGRGPPG